eukprot:scaffold226906_cov28-Attheya_sp.AAC.2
MPALSTQDKAVQAIHDLIALLRNPKPASPFLTYGPQATAAIETMADIFQTNETTTAGETQPPPRVPIHEATPSNLQGCQSQSPKALSHLQGCQKRKKLPLPRSRNHPHRHTSMEPAQRPNAPLTGPLYNHHIRPAPSTISLPANVLTKECSIPLRTR